jgi:predicted nucleotide-binding protein
MITTEADKLGLITDIKGKQYVNLGGTHGITSTVEHIELEKSRDSAESEDLEEATARTPAPLKVHPAARRVFITHGKNKDFIEPIKKLLSFGELEAVVSVESQSVSQPVPEKVMAEMRSCSAAIIHVAAEQVLIDKEANEHVVLNPNVLIEIGAAMALYGRRFILLVKSGVKMPSNLQGLFEVRYTSEPLDGDATIRLMEAINALKATQILEA